MRTIRGLMLRKAMFRKARIGEGMRIGDPMPMAAYEEAMARFEKEDRLMWGDENSPMWGKKNDPMWLRADRPSGAANTEDAKEPAIETRRFGRSRVSGGGRIRVAKALEIRYSIGDQPKPQIAMPPGYWMDRIAAVVFFLSRKKRRVFEEIVADYRHEMIEAEATRAPAHRLLMLRLQHWAGFIASLIDEFLSGVVGRVVKVLKGN